MTSVYKPLRLRIMLMSEALKKITELYVEATGRSLAGLSIAVGLNDKFFANVVRGKGVHMSSADQSLEWFSEHWPEGVEWPREIMRPRLANAAE